MPLPLWLTGPVARRSASPRLRARRHGLPADRLFPEHLRCRQLHEGEPKGNVAKPALSVQIARLEKELDVKLFERHPNGVVPTTAGKRFYEICQRIVGNVSDAKSEMAAFSGAVTGKVAVGLRRPPAARRWGDFSPHSSSSFRRSTALARAQPVGAAASAGGRCSVRADHVCGRLCSDDRDASTTAERFQMRTPHDEASRAVAGERPAERKGLQSVPRDN